MCLFLITEERAVPSCVIKYLQTFLYYFCYLQLPCEKRLFFLLTSIQAQCGKSTDDMMCKIFRAGAALLGVNDRLGCLQDFEVFG